MQLAIDAVERISSEHRLVVTGKVGWGDQSIGAKTIPVGYVDEDSLSALYSAAEIYLAPSRHEGFGIPLLEAFRCGCPVICSSGGALPEVAGGAAEVEPTWSSDHWAATIESLLGDQSKLEELRIRGMERERHFSWEDAAKKTIDVYHEAFR
jgi:alpha-1,3-rhamnosyl/mannosyltransferase